MTTFEEVTAARTEGHAAGREEAAREARDAGMIAKADIVAAVRHLMPNDARAAAFCAALETGASTETAKQAALAVTSGTAVEKAQADRDARRTVRLAELDKVMAAQNSQYRGVH